MCILLLRCAITCIVIGAPWTAVFTNISIMMSIKHADTSTHRSLMCALQSSILITSLIMLLSSRFCSFTYFTGVERRRDAWLWCLPTQWLTAAGWIVGRLKATKRSHNTTALGKGLPRRRECRKRRHALRVKKRHRWTTCVKHYGITCRGKREHGALDWISVPILFTPLVQTPQGELG